MDSARPPKKRKMDWLNVLLKTEFVGTCEDHIDQKKDKKEKNVFCIDCCVCCCKSCIVTVAHSEHKSLQILKLFNQPFVCLRDIQSYFDCTEIQTCKVRGETAVRLNCGQHHKTSKAMRSNIQCVDCEACGKKIQVQDSPKRFCSISCKVTSTTDFGMSDNHSSTEVDRSPNHAPEVNGSPDHAPDVNGSPDHAPDVNGSPDYTPEVNGSPDHSQTLDSGIPKLVVEFDLKGNPLGENKKKLLTKSLGLVKVVLGVEYEGWANIPIEKKTYIWENILDEFDIPLHNKENVMAQVKDQWRTWKKNIRKNYFGTTIEEILAWKDNVPAKESIIPGSQWNIFVEREATPKKLDQRAQSRINRGKKTDVHMLGSKSYAQVAVEWKERTAGTEDADLEPDRVNLYLHARKRKQTGEFHPSVADHAAKIAEIRNQGASGEANIETDALTKVLGKDKSGRTRGIGRISQTKLKAIHPLLSELNKLKNDMNEQKSMMVNVESSFSEKLDTVINMLHNRTPQLMAAAYAGGTSQSFQTLVVPYSPQFRKNTQMESSSTSAEETGCHHIRDLKNVKPIALGKIEEVGGGGKRVEDCALAAHEAKVRVYFVYPGNDKEGIYLGKQGSAENIGGCVGSTLVWPVYLLEKLD